MMNNQQVLNEEQMFNEIAVEALEKRLLSNDEDDKKVCLCNFYATSNLQVEFTLEEAQAIYNKATAGNPHDPSFEEKWQYVAGEQTLYRVEKTKDEKEFELATFQEMLDEADDPIRNLFRGCTSLCRYTKYQVMKYIPAAFGNTWHSLHRGDIDVELFKDEHDKYFILLTSQDAKYYQNVADILDGYEDQYFKLVLKIDVTEDEANELISNH